MKKLMLTLLAVILILTCTACNPTKTSIENTVNPTPTNNEPTATPEGTPTDRPTPTPTPTPTKVPSPFLASEFIKNPELWNGKRILDDKFQFIVEYNNDEVVKAGLGTNYNAFGGDFLHVKSTAGEWGGGLLNLYGIPDGAGIIHYFKYDPQTREEALEQIYEFLEKQYKSKLKEGDWLTSMNGAYAWQHYAGEAGFQCIGTEIGESIAAYQFRIAMNRGAARQYNTTWFVDFSQWFGGFVLDYNTDSSTWNEYSSLTGGHSISLMERSLLLAFMAGADATIAEGGQHIVSYERNFKDGMKLTPYGEFCKKYNEFTTKYNNVGTAYTPYAFILDKYHGMDTTGCRTAFGKFDTYYEDEFTYNILNKYIWSTTLDGIKGDEESSVMTNTEFGDTFDLLLQNAGLDLLKTYPALIFTGNIKLSEDELDTYAEYVKNGGKLILNTAYVLQFKSLDVELPEKLNKENYAEIPYGEGKFLVYGKGGMPDIITGKNNAMQIESAGDWKIGGLHNILTDLHNEYVPFTFSENIGYSISVKDGAMYLYVFNNNGVTKEVNKETVVDESKAIDLTINYTGSHIVNGVDDIYNNHEISASVDEFSIHLSAGDMAILEIKLG